MRLTLAGSSAQAPEGHRVAAAAAALTAMVSAAAASSSQEVLATVRSFVHSACSARFHASLRRTRKAARASASAAQAQLTASPAHGASGK